MPSLAYWYIVAIYVKGCVAAIGAVRFSCAASAGYSKGQLREVYGVIQLGYAVFPFAMRLYAAFEGLFRISSMMEMSSFSSGTVMIPAARK